MAITSTGRKNENSNFSAGSISVTLNSTVAGNLLVLVGSVWKSGGGPTTIAVSDAANGTWQNSFTIPVNADQSLVIAYVRNNAGGNLTITVDPSGGAAGDSNDEWCAVEEFTGHDTASQPSGTPVTNTGTSSSMSSGTTTPAVDGCLVVAGIGWDSANSITASGSPWVLSNENDISAGDTGQPGSFVYQILSTGAGVGISHTWTGGGSGAYAAGIIAFKPAGAGGGTTQQMFMLLGVGA